MRTGRYCSDRAELANLYVHLTNVAIQKKANDYDKEVGCKWDLRSLKVREPRVSTNHCFPLQLSSSLYAIAREVVRSSDCAYNMCFLKIIFFFFGEALNGAPQRGQTT